MNNRTPDLEKAKRFYGSIEIPDELSGRVEQALAAFPSRRRLHLRPAWSAAAAVFLTFLLLLNTSASFARSAAAVPGLGALARVLTVRNYNHNSGNDRIEVTVPAIRGLGDSERERKLNAQIETRIAAAAASVEKRVREARARQKADGGSPDDVIPAMFSADYEVKCNTPQLLSLVVNLTETRANAYTEQYFYTLDPGTGRDLTLPELLGPAYKRIADDFIRQRIAERSQEEGQIFFEDEEGFQGIGPRQSFYVNRNGRVVIVFNKYEIAPGCMGILEFELPPVRR